MKRTSSYLSFIRTAILAALAGLFGVLAPSACTKNSGSGDDHELEIGFGTPVVSASRTKVVTGEIGTDYSVTKDSKKQWEDFRVWAWYSTAPLTRADATSDGTTPNGVKYFDGDGGLGVKAFHTGSSLDYRDYWRLTPVYYWPKAGYLSFHALSPAEIGSYCTAYSHAWGDGVFIETFKVPDDPKDQIDLMYSDYVFNRQRGQYNGEDPYDDNSDDHGSHKGIDIKFNHALSSVHFKVKVDQDYEITGGRARIFLKKLEVLNAYRVGSFSENRAVDQTDNSYKSDSRPIWCKFKWSESEPEKSEKDSYVLYEKGSITGFTPNTYGDIPMISNGTWHVARNLTVTKGVEIIFRRLGSFDDVLGHQKGTIPYERGKEFDVIADGGTDINILAGGKYDVLLNPSEKKARIIEAQPASSYADFTDASEWGIHYTLGYKPNTTAYDLVDVDSRGNKFIGGYTLLAVPQPLVHDGANKWDTEDASANKSWYSGNDVKLRVTYSLKIGNAEAEKSSEVILYSVSNPSWLPGKRYTYTITLSLDKITVRPDVTDWIDIDPVE